MKIGFIGLGIMGSRMAANLIGAGYRLFLYNRTENKAKALAGEKVTVESSPEKVAEQSDIIFTMLANPEAVQDMALGEEGLLSGMSKGSVWVDCSTVNPSFSQQMAEITRQMGFNFIDAPVAGSVIPAEKGELTFLVGGRETIVKYCMPLFKVMGKKIVHVGDNGQGTAMKMVNNLVMASSMYGFIEGLVLGESLGIPTEKVYGLLENSPIAAPIMKMKKEKILNKEFSAEFPLRLLRKDLHLASKTAYEQDISLPGAGNIKEILALATQAGFGEKDMTAIYAYLSDQKGNEL